MPTRKRRISKKLEKGVYFTCQMCGKCCQGMKEGEIYLYQEDIENLSSFLGYEGEKGLKEFGKKYVSIKRHSYYWKAPNKSRGRTYYIDVLALKLIGNTEECQFLVDNECTVYKARPFQCRSFPIGWKMLMTVRKKFLAYARKCPGLKLSRKNQGNFHSREQMDKLMEKEEKLEQDYFLTLKKADFDIFRVYPFLSDIHKKD